MTPTRLIVLVSVLLVLGCGSGKGRLDSRTKEILANATKVEVFRIDGEPDSDESTRAAVDGRKISGYSVISQGEDLGHEFATELAEILRDEASSSKNFPACFWPGVGFRVWKDGEFVDLLICFRCNNLYVGPPVHRALENLSFSGTGQRPEFLKLAKKAFPNDSEIQGLADE